MSIDMSVLYTVSEEVVGVAIDDVIKTRKGGASRKCDSYTPSNKENSPRSEWMLYVCCN